MKKTGMLALLLALMMLVTSGCSLIVKDPEVDRQTVVLEVNGVAYTKGEVQQLVQEELEYQQYLYETQYGVALDIEDPEIISQEQDIVLDALTRQAVVDQKLEREGYLDLSDEELAQAEQMADATYQNYVNSFVTGFFADSDLSDEEKFAQAEEMMLATGEYPTREELLVEEKLIMAEEKLYNETVAGVTVDEAEVVAAYDQCVATAQTDYQAQPQYFDMDVSDGRTIFYYPAGYRYVKHILFSITPEDQAKLDEVDGKIADKQQEISSVQMAIDAGEGVLEDLLAEQQRLEEELAALQQEREALLEAAYAALKPTVEEVQGRLAQGEDFDALMAEYGSDPGMMSEPAKTTGYLVGHATTNYVQPFKEGAMALTQVGEVSAPVKTSFGVHLIQYTSDVVEGPVAYESVRAELEAELLSEKQSTVYYNAQQAWVDEADVKVYKNRLAD